MNGLQFQMTILPMLIVFLVQAGVSLQRVNKFMNNDELDEGSVVISKILNKKGDFGYNAKTDTYENMLKAGIIDPTKVTRIALENAASVAGMLLTTECVLADIKEDNPAPPMGAPGMGGGMPGMM